MLMPDEVLQNRYRIIAQLGKGSMGAVYRAWDLRSSVPVALKQVVAQPNLGDDVLEDLRAQFQQEAVTLARLNHPNLVGVTDYFQEGQDVYLVMEFIEGESLSERIRRQGAVPEGEVSAWSAQLLDALAYCHSQGVVHRDVKPQNIIIGPGEAAMLVDFGLVQLWDPGDPRSRSAVRGVGTPEYAPPEQYHLMTSQSEPRSDLYGLGATMYHALTGQAPPTATTRIAEPERFAPLWALAPQVSDKMAGAVERAMELPRSKRWSTASEMADGLGLRIRPWGQTGPEDARTEAVSGRGQTTRMDTANTQQIVKGRFPVWIAGLLALVLLGGVGAVAVLGLGLTGVLNLGIALRDKTPPTSSPPTEEIIPPTATATPSPTPDTETPTPEPTSTPTPTRTPQPSATATATVEVADSGSQKPTPKPTPKPTATVEPSPEPDVVLTGALVDFEQWGTWLRGDQATGELTQTTVQTKAGDYAAQLDYSFAGTAEDFVVFTQPRSIGGSPNAFAAWVYGDGSEHFLNLWIEDANGELWSVALGRVGSAGWQQMVGYLAPGLAWPSGRISGPDNGRVDYPVSFSSIVLDRPGTGSLTGRLYIDEITASVGTVAGDASQPVAVVPEATDTQQPETEVEGVGQILFTVQSADGFHLYTTDPAWTQMVEIGLIDYNQSTCAAGATAVSTLSGLTYNVAGIASCAVTERMDVCTSPDGNYTLITNFLPGYEYAVLLRDLTAGTEEFIYQGKLNQDAGIQWDATSRNVFFGINQTINIVTVGVGGYSQAVSTYDADWSPLFSPDGSEVLYLKPVGGGNSDVFLVNEDGSAERNLTNAPAVRKLCPRWRR
ncbi:MAG: serine/threonine-protein kinase [Anaerolineae bacterium]|nr:serine/threonine-protein kinase [Anaerolineae bacterium]